MHIIKKAKPTKALGQHVRGGERERRRERGKGEKKKTHDHDSELMSVFLPRLKETIFSEWKHALTLKTHMRS